MLRKLIRNHQWISQPDADGKAFFGITDFAKNYFLRFSSVTHQQYFKSQYGINYSHRIEAFLKEVYLKGKQALTLSEQMEIDRFRIRQDQPFSMLKCFEFDVELTAPVDMRIIDINFDVSYNQRIYQQDWIYKVQVLQPCDLTNLMTAEQYDKSNKIISYDGLLL